MSDLIKNTAAFKIIAGDKRAGRLSHAYLVTCADELMLPEYTKAFCKLALCGAAEYCNECRTCRLIEKNAYADASFYPAEGAKKILTADVDAIIAHTYVKPLENERRAFVLNFAESMTVAAQNKLLKTLEEPPAGVIIILGATNEYSLLPTVKSRVKRLDIQLFSQEELLSAYSGRAEKSELEAAVFACGGKEGELLKLLSGSEKLSDDLAFSVLLGMKNTRRLLEYSEKIDKESLRPFLASLKRVLLECARYKSVKSSAKNSANGEGISGRLGHSGYCNSSAERGERIIKIAQIAEIYPLGCMLKTIEKINSAERALFFNGNATMVLDGVLLTLLEEKHKWLKL